LADSVPNIIAVHAGRGRSVAVTWKAGGESLIDLSGHFALYEIFGPLRAGDARFGEVAVGEWGWCLHWSAEMEISADTLWRLALEQGAAWLQTWRRRHRMTQAAAARALGVSSRMWRYYEAGSHILPKTVRLAAIGLDAEARAA
jgi:Helix-turn-helix domain